MLTVQILTGITPSALHGAAELATSAPVSVVASYAERSGWCVVRDGFGPVDQRRIDSTEDCAACAVAADAAATIALLTGLDRWKHAVLVLPPGSDAGGVVARLADADGSSDRWPGPALVVAVWAVVDAESAVADLTGDELLLERDLAPTGDRRNVAEVLLRQVEYADSIWLAGLTGPPSAVLRSLLATLNPTARQADPGSFPLAVSTDRGRTAFAAAEARTRVLPGVVHAPLARSAAGVGTVYWRSTRPMHPQRLRDQLAEIVTGVVRSRGRLWLANRPRQMLAWESAGGSASIGALGTWLADTPAAGWADSPPHWQAAAALDWDDEVGDRCCELEFIGVDLDQSALSNRLGSCLVTDAEYYAGEQIWRSVPDPFAAALGAATVVDDEDLARDSR